MNRKKLAETTGLDSRSIQFYTESNIITVKNSNIHTGRGHERDYGPQAVDECKIIVKLRKIGMTLSPIRKILQSKKALDIKTENVNIATDLLFGLME